MHDDPSVRRNFSLEAMINRPEPNMVKQELNDAWGTPLRLTRTGPESYRIDSIDPRTGQPRGGRYGCDIR
jgi:hypothetical protein